MDKAEQSTDIFSITHEGKKCTKLLNQPFCHKCTLTNEWNTDLSLLTPKTLNTPDFNLATLGTLCVIHYLLQTGGGIFQLQECFRAYVWTCALHRYLTQACTFANLIMLKYHYFAPLLCLMVYRCQVIGQEFIISRINKKTRKWWVTQQYL